jgi:nucleoside-diphosphate-sugar epimerase
MEILPMGKIALFGATGAIGHSVAAALREAGRPYRVVGRSRAALEASFGPDSLAEIVTWDPADRGSVRRAAAGIETIVYLVGVHYTEFRLHPILMREALEGAIAAGVPRILLIGTVYPFGVPRTERVDESHPRAPHTFKGRMRKEQEDLVLAAHAAGRIQGTILRLPDFYGPGIERSYAYSLFRAAAKGGRAELIGPVDRPHEYVYVPDVGPVVLALAEEPRAYGHAWHLGGAGTITPRAFAAQVFSAAGREPRLLVTPKWLLRAMGLFVAFLREVAEMQYLFETPVMLDDTALHGLLGEIRKTLYAEGIRRTLAAMGAQY